MLGDELFRRLEFRDYDAFLAFLFAPGSHHIAEIIGYLTQFGGDRGKLGY